MTRDAPPRERVGVSRRDRADQRPTRCEWGLPVLSSSLIAPPPRCVEVARPDLQNERSTASGVWRFPALSFRTEAPPPWRVEVPRRDRSSSGSTASRAWRFPALGDDEPQPHRPDVWGSPVLCTRARQLHRQGAWRLPTRTHRIRAPQLRRVEGRRRGERYAAGDSHPRSLSDRGGSAQRSTATIRASA